MRQPKIQSLILFVAGVATALGVMASGRVLPVSAARYEDLSLFTSVLHLVRRNYVEDVDETDLIRGAVRGMLAELDPHSSYMDPDAHREMQDDTKGEFHGLGIEISKRRDGYIEVVAPIDGTPAASAGIRPRDQIVEICPTEPPEEWDGEPCRATKTMSLFEAVKLMRGRRGTEITIRVFREGFDRPKAFKIVRDVVKVASVDGRLLEDGYGYVRIRAFQQNTAEDLDATLAKIAEESNGALKGLVLDLRDNPGGLLDQAVRVADRWLSDGLIVYTKGRVESQQQEFRAHPDSTDTGYPMVVLVNAGSASASEIVAGALQDQSRALVLGTGTFGKGSVQTVYPLDDHSGLRLTTALYYTPVGRSIQEVGIVPDINVEARPSDAGDASDGSRPIRERDLDGHFHHEDAEPETAESEEPEAVVEETDASAEGEDIQLVRGLEVLKSWAYFERLQKAKRSPSVARVPEPATPPTP